LLSPLLVLSPIIFFVLMLFMTTEICIQKLGAELLVTTPTAARSDTNSGLQIVIAGTALPEPGNTSPNLVDPCCEPGLFCSTQ
jgi:hypothetical protein